MRCAICTRVVAMPRTNGAASKPGSTRLANRLDDAPTSTPLSGYIRQRRHQTTLDGQDFQASERLRGDRHLVTSSLEKVDSKLFTHPLSITIKDIEVKKNDGKQEPMTILAVKSADKRWKISLSHTGWFMLKEYIGPAFGTTFLVDNCIYIIIFTPMWKTEWNGLSAEIYRKALYNDVVKPFIGKLLPQ